MEISRKKKISCCWYNKHEMIPSKGAQEKKRTPLISILECYIKNRDSPHQPHPLIIMEGEKKKHGYIVLYNKWLRHQIIHLSFKEFPLKFEFLCFSSI